MNIVIQTENRISFMRDSKDINCQKLNNIIIN